ncbi:MAG TPA: hypothetical protein VJL10_08885 [Anaerolineales bacterium]|nr:hypothetical protein [Anaerolineales bacterium]
MTQAKSGGAKKIGRNKEKCARYRAMHTREMNKVRRILRSNGWDAAQAYAAKNGVVGYLSKLVTA